MNDILMRAIVGVVVILAGPITWVSAADIPEPGELDQRVRYVTYQHDDVTTIHVRRGVITRIILSKDERILNAATGFFADCGKEEAEWCIRADEGTNQVWVKPKEKATHNNLEIRTTDHDYSFEFKVLPNSDHGRWNASQANHGLEKEAMYRVIFRYNTPESTFGGSADQTRREEDQQILADRLDAYHPQPKNWNYSMNVLKGADDIAPALVFDDGRFTYFSFPPNRDIPAIFVITQAGEETRLNVHMENDLAVVQRMGRRFVLRLGGATVGIWNDADNVNGVPPANGVAVPGVIRSTR